MTKSELIEALDLYFEDDETVVCAESIESGSHNILCLGRTGDKATIFFEPKKTKTTV